MATKDRMELNFDKEMDALLRQAARSGEFVSTDAQTHLDADEISAFAENALPERARVRYMKHLADCDRCRSVLSNLILLNTEEETETDSSTVIAPVIAEAKMPWYRRIFAVTNLAYTLGGLVILFGGFLGFLVFQSSNNFQNTEGLRVAEDAPRTSGPNIGSGEAIYNSNAASAANIANTPTNSAANTSVTVSNMTTTNTGVPTSTTTNTTIAAPTPELLARENRDAQKLLAEEKTETKAQTEDEKARNEKDVAAADQNLAQEKESAKPTPVPAKPAQAAPPTDSAAGRSELSTSARAKRTAKEDKKTAAASENTRQVSGKTFNRRDRVWYDAAFSGQSTTNVRRNTENYRKLERGLRIIAESLEGTVVVVWKEKAYRIQ